MADVFGDLSLFSEFERNREAEGTFIRYDEDAERSRIIFEGFESEEEEEEDDIDNERDASESDSKEVEESDKHEADKADADDGEKEKEVEGENKKEEQEMEEGEEVQSKSEESKKDKKPDVNGSTSDTKTKTLSIEDTKTIAWLNEQLHLEAEEEAQSNVNINQTIYEKNKYKRFCKIFDSTRHIQDEDSPAVQLLFSNNSFSRKYRQQIEQFIKGLLWSELNSNTKMSDAFQEVAVRPGAPSCIDINSQLKPGQRTEAMRQKHTFIGGSQFHNKFLIDFLGWPFSMSEPTRCNVNWEIPLYSQVFNEVFADPSNKGKQAPKKKLKPACWNCSGNHSVAECRLPRNPARIAASRKEFMDQQQAQQPANKNKFKGASRYHLDPEIASKYARFQPGQISEALTKALGIRDDQLPLHIFNMRLYGYPPGWLAEAKQIQSDVNVFDKHGQATLISGECLEDGELDIERDPSGDFDINKIIEYPGLTVPVPEGIIDEHELHFLPPIQEHQLKSSLLSQAREKIAARKRKRKREEEKKAEENAKKVKVEPKEGEEGEDKQSEDGKVKEKSQDSEEADGQQDSQEKTQVVVSDDEDSDRTLDGTQELETGVVEVPKMIKHSSTISLSKDYGTPILVREKSDLPDASKFGVGVEEHIPFENLPNSTGTFEKMKSLIDVIRKKKSESL